MDLKLPYNIHTYIITTTLLLDSKRRRTTKRDKEPTLVALKPIILQYTESANLAGQFGKSISDFEAKRFQAYVKATFRFPAIYITGKEASGATSGTAEGHLSWIHKITSSWKPLEAARHVFTILLLKLPLVTGNGSGELQTPAARTF